MADIRDLFVEVRRSARGVPEPTMRDAILRAARTFCKESWYVRRMVQFTCDPTQTNPANYLIPTVANEEALNVQRAAVQYASGYQQALDPLSAARIDPNVYSFAGTPRWFSFTPVNNIVLTPAPDQAYVVTCLVPIQPIKAGSTIPDEIAQNYDEVIGQGALAWIFRMKGSEWYDPREAAILEGEFNRGWTRAKVEALRDFKSGELRADPTFVVNRNLGRRGYWNGSGFGTGEDW